MRWWTDARWGIFIHWGLYALAEAFREQGLRVGFYYSLLDWHHPDYPVDKFHPMFENQGFHKKNKNRDIQKYTEYLHHQVEELLTRWGEIRQTKIILSNRWNCFRKNDYSRIANSEAGHGNPGDWVDAEIKIFCVTNSSHFCVQLKFARWIFWDTCYNQVTKSNNFNSPTHIFQIYNLIHQN